MRIAPNSEQKRRSHSSRRPEKGFVIVAVLWLLIMLAGLAAIYSTYQANTALAVQVNDTGVQVEALSSAAVELVAYQLTAAPKDKRPSRGAFNIRLGQATVAVRYTTEAARIDLNAAGKQLLAGLFGALGAAAQDADRFAGQIIAWRNPTNPNLSGRQNGQSQASVRADRDGGQFAHVDELWLVAGLPPALVERALPYLTVYSGHSDINILVASPQVLAALPDMSPQRLDSIVNRRSSASPLQSPEDLVGSDQPGATTDVGDTFRINVGIAFDSGRYAASEVVILINRDEDIPYHVLSWLDDSDVALRNPG